MLRKLHGVFHVEQVPGVLHSDEGRVRHSRADDTGLSEIVRVVVITNKDQRRRGDVHQFRKGARRRCVSRTWLKSLRVGGEQADQAHVRGCISGCNEMRVRRNERQHAGNVFRDNEFDEGDVAVDERLGRGIAANRRSHQHKTSHKTGNTLIIAERKVDGQGGGCRRSHQHGTFDGEVVQ